MVDGIGMCGGCRVVVDARLSLACCDGPEFDAHLVEWHELMNRNKTYIDEEKCAGKCKMDDINFSRFADAPQHKILYCDKDVWFCKECSKFFKFREIKLKCLNVILIP